MAYKKKRHHYVSQFLLQHFALDPEGKRVYTLTQKGIIPDEPNKISDICYEKNYNTKLQEEEQSRLEKKYAKVLREFIASPNPDTLNLSRDFIEFVCFMMGNNIFIREAIADLSSDVLRTTLGSIFRADISPDIGYRGQLKSSIDFAKCVFKEFQNWKFVCHRAHNGRKYFITSDNPVTIFNPKNVLLPGETEIEIKNPDIILSHERMLSEYKSTMDLKLDFTFNSVSLRQDVVLLFPVSPSICLVGFSSSKTHARYMEYPKNNVNFPGLINSIIFNQCNKAVYSHSMDFLKGIKADWRNFQNYFNSNGIIPSLDLVLGNL